MRTGTLPDVRPISDLRQNMAEVMESIDTENRPVILTKHGRGRYVLLSIEEYNRNAALDMLHKAIDEGIADIEAGRVSDFREFARQFREEIKNGTV
ncbi:MAG: type II toxin-antitoxin system Phd/YefM family antitoxin [Oscillospiraceae bacterium]|nr:type II toxin-antitoxin system Phd/YefM family antitoxin [Oscillospiraceae bacterium]